VYPNLTLPVGLGGVLWLTIKVQEIGKMASINREIAWPLVTRFDSIRYESTRDIIIINARTLGDVQVVGRHGRCSTARSLRVGSKVRYGFLNQEHDVRE